LLCGCQNVYQLLQLHLRQFSCCSRKCPQARLLIYLIQSRNRVRVRAHPLSASAFCQVQYKHLIEGLLTKNPENRIGLSDPLFDNWYNEE